MGRRDCRSNPAGFSSDSVLRTDGDDPWRIHAAYGDVLLVNKIGFRLKNPHRMDLVLLEIENGTTTHYTVKRVIGLPGEKIKISEGKIFINGKEQKISFEEEILSAGLAAYEIELGEDEYFVMGDNCNNSEDSRVANIGNIKRTQFVGKIAGRIKKWTSEKH